jgi:metal-dependent hydrolase (beta-lactamase superfamily II)
MRIKIDKEKYIGCSHPVFNKILSIAEQIENIVGIVGGFYGFNRFSIIKDFNYICPCYCAVHKQVFKRALPDITSNCKV